MVTSHEPNLIQRIKLMRSSTSESNSRLPCPSRIDMAKGKKRHSYQMNVRNEIAEAPNRCRGTPQQKHGVVQEQGRFPSGTTPFFGFLFPGWSNGWPEHYTTQDDEEGETAGEAKHTTPSILLQDHLLKAGEGQSSRVATTRCYASGE